MLRTYLSTGKLPTVRQAGLLFKKDTSWQSEAEFRIIASSDFLRDHPGTEAKQGIYLEKVIPTQIVIGYKMDPDKEEKMEWIVISKEGQDLLLLSKYLVILYCNIYQQHQ